MYKVLKKEYSSFKSNSDVREALLTRLAKVEVDKEEAVTLTIQLQDGLERLEGAVGAVVGCSTLDMFFRKHVKNYTLSKTPGQPYTSRPILEAYVNFLKDENNIVATSLRKRFPDMEIEALAKLIRKFFGKLSWYDHILLDAFKKVETLENLMRFIQSIPVALRKDERVILEEVLQVYLEFNEE